MITVKKYQNIKEKYGHYASWAVWAEPGDKPKSNIGDLSIFDLNANPGLLELLNPEIIMVGLNISRPVQFCFGNFHDARPQSQDYKIRYAFNGTRFYGAYMTDIIKDFENVISGDVERYLRLHPEFNRKNFEIFENEITDLGVSAPTIIAFGNITFNLLQRYFRGKYPITKVPHYSMRINKEKYRKLVKQLIS